MKELVVLISRFKKEDVVNANETARIAYGESNPVSWSVEDKED